MSTTEDAGSPATVSTVGGEKLPLEYSEDQKKSGFRWVILGLVFIAITINYLDRLIMAVLSPDLLRIFKMTKVEYGWTASAFALSYAFGQVICGGLLDKIGVRIGYAASIAAWSISAMLHAFAKGPIGFSVARGLLGVSESPAYPAATKTLAEWFPKRERAFAFGFVNAGSNMGAILAPMVIPILAGPEAVHWQWAFIASGLVGLLWLFLWIPLYRSPEVHPRVNAAELAYINSDPPESKTKVPWLVLITYPQAWAFAFGKFLTDSMWWFYMSWFPNFLHDRHNLDLLHIGLPLVVVYVMADIGAIAGGWLSSIMIKMGYSINVSRKIAMLVPALGVIPIMFAQNVSAMWMAVLLMGLATASHQAFSSNLYTIVSDMFPKRAVASIAGLGGMCGYFGAAIFQPIVGHLVEEKNNYLIPFICAGSAYLLALGIIHLLAPRMREAIMDDNRQTGFEVIPSAKP